MKRVALACVSSAAVALLFLGVTEINQQPEANFAAMMDGTAVRPFAYRVLVPKLMSLLLAMTPDALRTAIEAGVAATPLPVLFDRVKLPDPVIGLYLVLILTAALMAYRAAFQYLAATFYPERAELASYLALFSIVPLFRYGYFYDFPALAFGTLLFALMFRARWAAYLATFLLACLNKETTILFAGIFAVCGWRPLDRKTYLALIAAQVLLWAAVRLPLMAVYADNPGGDAIWYFGYNLRTYARLGASAALAGLAVGALLFLVFWRFNEKPRALRLGLVGIPPMAVLFLLFGYPYEFRVFYEVLPPALLLAMHRLLVRRETVATGATAILARQA